jgi:UPF0755 protein
VRIDELELGWEDDTERGRHRHRRSRRTRRADENGGRGRGGRTAVALLLTLVIILALAGGVWYGFNKVNDYFKAPDYNSGGTTEVIFEVRKGQNAREIGDELYKQGIVKSQKAFVQAADANPRSREIQPGFYRLQKEMRAADVVSRLLDREAFRVVTKFVVPEGKTVREILDIASKGSGLPLADFQAAAKDPIALGIPDWWFNRTDKKAAAKALDGAHFSLEGFLFPMAYEFNPGATAVDILKKMVAQFISVVTQLDFVAKSQNERKISPYEALIVASLAQAEAGIDEDLPKIARVAYNRAYKANMPLQFDVTANYWLQLQGKPTKPSGQLTAQELDDPKNPYNTVSVKGLPAGPINNPGEKALLGALNPPDAPWLYFVAIDKTGRSAFASTPAEHDKNVQQACANGVPLCGRK